jgi:hypothetical protein
MKSPNARAWFALPRALTRGKFHPAIVVTAADGREIVAVGRHKPNGRGPDLRYDRKGGECQ